MSHAEDRRNELWLLLDKAFTSLYNSKEKKQKENIIESIDSIIKSLKDWKCLPNGCNSDLFSWLLQNFTYILINRDFKDFHRIIISSSTSLIKILSVTPVLFCGAIKLFLRIVQSFLNNYTAISVGKCSFVVLKGDNTYLYSLQNDFSTVPVSPNATIKPLFDCFIEVCYRNVDSICNISPFFCCEILEFLLNGYQIIESNNTEKVTRLILILPNQAFSQVTSTDWKRILDIFFSLRNDKEVVDLFSKLLQHLQIIKNYSIVHKIFLQYLIKFIEASCRTRNFDLSEWINTSKSLIEILPGDEVNCIDLEPLLEYTFDNEELCILIQAYLHKYIELHSNSNNTHGSDQRIHDISSLSGLLVSSSNRDIENILKEPSISCSQIAHLVNHLTILLNLKTLSEQYHLNLITYGEVSEKIFEIFNILSYDCREDILSNLVKLSEICICILSEKLSTDGRISAKPLQYLYKFVYTPWSNESFSSISDGLKVKFFDSVNSLFHLLINVDEYINLAANMFEDVYDIASNDDKLLGRVFYSFVVCLFLDKKKRRRNYSLYLKTFFIDARICHLLRDFKVRHLLPCIISDSCYLERGSCGFNIKCVDCDAPNKEGKVSRELDLSSNSDFVGASFINALTASEDDFPDKRSLLQCFKRYVKHIPLISSPDMFESLAHTIILLSFHRNVTLTTSLKPLLLNSNDIKREQIFRVMRKVLNMYKHDKELEKLFHRQLFDVLIDISYASNHFLLLTVKVLFLIIFYSASTLVEIGFLKSKLNKVLISYSMDEKGLVALYEKELSELWVSAIIMNIQNETLDPEETLSLIASVFDMDVTSFLEFRCTPYMIVDLLKKCDYEQIQYVLTHLCGVLYTTTKDLIIRHFVVIFSSVYFDDDEDQVSRAIIHIEQLSENAIDTLIYYSFKDLICYIILNIHHTLKVCRFFQAYVYHGKDVPTDSADMLLPYTVGFLTFIDAKLSSQSTPSFMKQLCLQSIPNLIIFLGQSNVLKVHIRFLATLRTGLPLHYESFPHECYLAWTIFLHSIDLKVIGPYLTTIVTLLLPLSQEYPEDISKLLNFLVVNNKDCYEDYLPELFFLKNSNLPDMESICSEIEEVTNKLGVVDGLSTLLEHIKSGAVESQVHSLQYLFHYLTLQKNKLLVIVNHTDQLPILFHELMNCLMINIHYGNTDVRNICVKCLGEFGALNPARYGRGIESDSIKKYIDVKSEEFAFLVIRHLTNALQKSKDSYTYNTIASSIQELLKVYFPERSDEKIDLFLQRFPLNERSIVKPMLGSRYIFIEPVLMKKGQDKIGFNNHSKNIFQWASSWASELVAVMPPDSFVRKVFKMCLSGIEVDPAALEALLPHILLHAILTGSKEDSAFIVQKVKSILKFQDQNYLAPSQYMNLLGHISKEMVDHHNVSMAGDKCVTVVLDLIDFLYNFLHGTKVSKKSGIHQRIAEFLDRFALPVISLKAYLLGDYCRALFHLEREYSESVQSNEALAPFRNIYAKLNDADGLLGIIRCSNKIPTIEESILNHIVCGNIEEALPAYEILASKHKTSTEWQRALMQCYLNVNAPYTTIMCSRAYYNKRCNESLGGHSATILNELTEGDWKSLLFNELLNIYDSFDPDMKNGWSWSADIGIAFLNFMKLEFDDMRKKTDLIRVNIGEHLAAISNTTVGAYRQGYNHIVNLHILSELEMYGRLADAIFNSKSKHSVILLLEEMNMEQRLGLLPSNSYFVLNVMNFRIQVLSMINSLPNLPSHAKPIIEITLGTAYCKAAQIARKNSNFKLASTYLALAENYQSLGLFIEKAKLHEARHETDNALIILKEGIKASTNPTNELVYVGLNKINARAKLLIARYNVENMNVDYTEGTQNYLDAISTFPTEKNYMHLAKYLYQIHSSQAAPDNTSNKCAMQYQCIYNFGKSLQYGCKYIYQSMVCMISLWLDYGARYKNVRDAIKRFNVPASFAEEYMTKMDTLMAEYLNVIPTYMYMAVFSQLLSRINHPYPSCQQALIEIISRVALDYPHQAFWMMAPLWKTKDTAYNKCGDMVLVKMKQLEKISGERNVIKFFDLFNDLVDIICSVCNKAVPHNKSVVPLKSVSNKLRVLLISHPNSIMIPAQKFRTISLPNVKHFDSDAIKMQHKPFPMQLAYFADVEDEVYVLQSLQRPKKLTFRGSDGLSYPFLFKPKDDLRLDSRIMEFCSVVNMYLQRDPPSSDRNLHIRTYSVVPINPAYGIIEWIPNLLGYRAVTLNMYNKQSYKIPDLSKIKDLVESARTPGQKLKVFQEMLAAHPPVLHKWYFQQFPSPDLWYFARKSYVRTAAVMSIVGYIVGLGDRHGANILLDTTTGEIMHVDFNCVFMKGDTLPIPERVPFRLTQNMVTGMGLTGIEGHFMKACEITNRVVRNHSDQLLYVLKPFLYDPQLHMGPNTEEKAKTDLNNIQKKMAGCVLTLAKKTQPLSVEGQVRCLVTEATSHENLSQMYYGWHPFL